MSQAKYNNEGQQYKNEDGTLIKGFNEDGFYYLKPNGDPKPGWTEDGQIKPKRKAPKVKKADKSYQSNQNSCCIIL